MLRRRLAGRLSSGWLFLFVFLVTCVPKPNELSPWTCNFRSGEAVAVWETTPT
ncbi:hypothetical protein GQ55_1G081100 [Panicum hallii var. hallii]|uniref:Leucine-rich repeat-containing N-terminal plant-type domain-containing protein n=1 Tax=Panicum hallii var. hallii TaxID=1504633 RepID=A0A2T7F3I1_9POAL|nr:hypothetical protein GQ55_1G081100 [Panicum hallii var. hallii]